MCLSLMVLGKKIHMENRVDLHGWGKGQMIGDRGELLGDKEGAVALGCQLYSQVMGL